MLPSVVAQNAALICLVADWDGDAAPTVSDLARSLKKDPENTRKTVKLLVDNGSLAFDGSKRVEITDGGRAQVPALRVVTGEREVDEGVILLTAAQIMRHPLNPRTSFAAEDLEGLADSIAENGLLENLVVRPMAEPGFVTTHWLVAGERRWRAIRLLIDRKDPRWPAARKIRCGIVHVDDVGHLVLAVLENFQRKDLDMVEEAKGFKSLEDAGLKPSAIAKKIGCTARHVQRRLQFLTCDADVQKKVLAGDMSFEAALATVQTKKPEPKPTASEDASDPLVVDGKRFGNATWASEARRLAAGGGPSASASKPRGPHPDEATDASISPAQALLLGEILHKQITKPEYLKGTGDVVTLDEDAPRDLREQLRPLLWGGYLAMGSHHLAGASRDYIRATSMAEVYLRKQHKLAHGSFEALKKLRFSIGARPNTGCQYVTPWLNWSAGLAKFESTTSQPELNTSSEGRFALPFPGPAGDAPWGTFHSTDWWSPEEQLVAVELADKCLRSPSIASPGGEDGWTEVDTSALEVKPLHGGIISIKQVEWPARNAVYAKFHFNAGCANECGGAHGALTRLGFYRDRDAALLAARAAVGIKAADIGGRYATDWLHCAMDGDRVFTPISASAETEALAELVDVEREISKIDANTHSMERGALYARLQRAVEAGAEALEAGPDDDDHIAWAFVDMAETLTGAALLFALQGLADAVDGVERAIDSDGSHEDLSAAYRQRDEAMKSARDLIAAATSSLDA